MAGGKEELQVFHPEDDGSDLVVVRGGIAIKLQFNANGGVDVFSNVPVTLRYAANDTAAKATHEIGVRDRDGAHKGQIYGGVFPDGKPGWISEEPNPMSHFDAVKLKGRALPTGKEGKYIDTIKDKGELKKIFDRHSDGSSSAGYFWLAEHGDYDLHNARYQQFSSGSQSHDYGLRGMELPVLSVRR
jgi:hypothetical protein